MCFCPEVLGQPNINPYRLDTVSFKTSELDKKSFLVLPGGKRIEIPKMWLYPSEEVKQDQHSYVSSFNYLEPVTGFPINRKLLGLHLSSWDYMPLGSGSAMAASGRDIFLIYNRATHKLMPGILDLGITKERVRSMGCFFASFNEFYLGDVNNDGLTDIGVTLEKIWCEEVSDEDRQMNFMSGPYYKKNPIEWYILRGLRWERAPQYEGIRPKKAIMKLPMIGLIESPVEFVRGIYKEELKEVK
jgi:hypothetical protein